MELAIFEATLRRSGALICSIGAADWTRPTPCTEWDVRALVGHLVASTRRFAAAARGEAPPDETTPAAGDLAAAYRAAAAAAIAAWRQRGALERNVVLPSGELPGAAALRLQLAENLVHQWDLAVALGRDATLDTAAVAVADAFARQLVTPEMRQPGGPLGPEVAVGSDASPAERLLGFLGRDVARWTAAHTA